MKLHMGCGSVYLLDWWNVDLPLSYIYLAGQRPELVERYSTVESEYYGRHDNQNVLTWRAGPQRIETVCDAYGSFTNIPARPQSVDELLSRQVFEHLNFQQAHLAFTECYRVMCHGGILRIDVPDPEETIKLYGQTQDNFYLRHFFGPRSDEFGFHTPYTRGILVELARQHGFTHTAGDEEPNIHPYPAFCLRFRRGV